MRLYEFENNIGITVFYGGRFQPMHVGHYQLYKDLIGKFGADNVFIATMFGQKQQKMHKMDDFSTDPFTFEEKQRIMARMFKISPNRVIETQPYKPDVSMVNRDPDNTAVVLAFSEKDAGRLQHNGRFKELPTKFDNLLPVSAGVSYFITMPVYSDNMSATDFRNIMSSDTDAQTKQDTFKQFFGNFDQAVFNFIERRLTTKD